MLQDRTCWPAHSPRSRRRTAGAGNIQWRTYRGPHASDGHGPHASACGMACRARGRMRSTQALTMNRVASSMKVFSPMAAALAPNGICAAIAHEAGTFQALATSASISWL